MKKLILFAAILFAGSSVVKAESPHTDANISNTATTNLKIELKTIQSIIVGHEEVLFSFETIEHYANPSLLDQTKTDHLKIYSTGGFAVTVKQESTDDAGDLIFASFGVEVPNFGKVMLTADEDHDLFSADKGGANLTYDVKYSTTPTFDYMNKIVNAENTTYETTVTYTIAPN